MERQILLVELAGRTLGLPLALVREIFTLAPVTPVPGAPACVAGLTHLRGRLVPLLDLPCLMNAGTHRLRLGDPVVLVQAQDLLAGLLVDRVVGIVHRDATPEGTLPQQSEAPQVLDIALMLTRVQAEVLKHSRPDGPGGAPIGEVLSPNAPKESSP